MLWIHYWYECADFKRFCSSLPISVWASLCRMIHVQSLTLEDRFYILNLICAIFLFFLFFLTWETFLAVVPRSQINNRGNEAHFWRPVAALFYNKSPGWTSCHQMGQLQQHRQKRCYCLFPYSAAIQTLLLCIWSNYPDLPAEPQP